MHPGLTSRPDHQSPRPRSTLASPSPRPVGLEAPSRPSALPFPLPGRPGAFPTTALFAECTQSGARFGAPSPKERCRRGRSQQPAPALLRSSPEDKLRGSRCPAVEELGHEGARHGELTTRPKVGSAGAGGSEEKGGRADEVGAAEVDAAEEVSGEAADSHPGDELLDFARVPSMLFLMPVLDACHRGHTQLGCGLGHHIGTPHQEDPSNALCQSASLGRSHYLNHQHEDCTKLINTTHTKNSFLIWNPAFPSGAV